jgi:hypothetical protein
LRGSDRNGDSVEIPKAAPSSGAKTKKRQLRASNLAGSQPMFTELSLGWTAKNGFGEEVEGGLFSG